MLGLNKISRMDTKLKLIVLIPMLVLIFFEIVDNYTTIKELNGLNKLKASVELSNKLGSLLHETQKERGATAGYIGSKGLKFKNTLGNQRDTTDKTLADLNKFLKTFEKQGYGSKFNENLNTTNTSISKIPSIRSMVNAINMSSATAKELNAKTKTAISFYTKTNGQILNTVSSIVNVSDDAEILKKLNSYLVFMMAKERAGIERAVLSNTFGKKKFGPGMKLKFISLVEKQEAYLDSFIKGADSETITFYKETVQGKAIEEVNRMRKVAFSKNEGFEEDASYWFTTITKKINKLKKVENYLAKKALSQVDSKIAKVKKHSVIFITISIIVLFFTIFISYYIAKNIRENMASLKMGIEEFFAYLNYKTDHCEEIKSTSSCELGQIAALVNENIINIENNIATDKKMIEDAIKVASKISEGHLDVSISSTPYNPSLIELKEIINQMLFSLNGNVSSLMKVLNSYSNLDYRARVENNTLEGEFKELISDVNDVGKTITQMLVKNLKDGKYLSEESTRLSSSMERISESANIQAASLEETAASIEEITSNISNNTTTAIEMGQYGQRVKESVDEGNTMANKTVDAMNNINDTVSNINDAITVIDQIAFQTNILSLNAAVEAATAGEAGKGFAVVAQEVRNLANRSAEAAKTIKEMVESATERANDGKHIADIMIEGYQKLNENIDKTIEKIADVEMATKEQQAGIAQINDAVNSLDQITQQNAQSASSVASTSGKIKKIAENNLESTLSKEFDGKY